jgi:hypothetical protein
VGDTILTWSHKKVTPEETLGTKMLSYIPLNHAFSIQGSFSSAPPTIGHLSMSRDILCFITEA